MHDDRWRYAHTRITLVVGPPGSPLAEYVASRRGESDLVIDYEAIAHSLGASGPLSEDDPLHWATMDARNALLRMLRQGECKANRAWIVSTNPGAEALFPFHEVGGPGLDQQGDGITDLSTETKYGGGRGSAVTAGEWHAARATARQAVEVVPSRTW
jgi:hypothetical protein